MAKKLYSTRPAEVQSPEGKVVMAYFDGMQPHSDPHEVRPGISVHQVNVSCTVPNELRVRLGTRQIKFDSF